MQTATIKIKELTEGTELADGRIVTDVFVGFPEPSIWVGINDAEPIRCDGERHAIIQWPAGIPASDPIIGESLAGLRKVGA